MELSTSVLTTNLRESFVTHKGSTRQAHQIIVNLEHNVDSAAIKGLGTAVPAKELGMTLESIADALQSFKPVLRSSSPEECEAIVSELELLAPSQPSAVAAIDMAVQDLLGKIHGKPVRELWSIPLPSLPLPTAISIGNFNEAETAAKLSPYLSWPIIKLKLKPDTHVETLMTSVRSIYHGRIWIDGNGSWSLPEAIKVSHLLDQYDVELFEQPTPPGQPDSLIELQKQSPITVVADEDFCGLSDLDRFSGKVGAINIKLLKCGGLLRAREIIHRANESGTKVMLGCKTESCLGITALVQLAPLADFLDLDGHVDLLDDPFQGAFIQEGILSPSDLPGIGVTFKHT